MPRSWWRGRWLAPGRALPYTLPPMARAPGLTTIAPMDSSPLPPMDPDPPAAASIDGFAACPEAPGFRLAPGEDIWVFGYGSLMWNPGFPHIERQPALVRGWHRRFCVYSFHYRGTPERPGLVLGLDRGGSCRGVAFRVAAADAPATLAYLWEREMISAVYRPAVVAARLPGAIVRAAAFVADRCHEQYCHRLDDEAMAAVIAAGHGLMGPNRDYLDNTVRHLDELGIADTPIHALAERVRQIAEGG